MAVEEQVPLIYAGVNGHLDNVPVNRIGRFEEGGSCYEFPGTSHRVTLTLLQISLLI